MTPYAEFLDSKRHLGGYHGFDPLWVPSFLYDFQADIVSRACRRGRSAIFADCGLGKTPMELVWSVNVAMRSGLPVLITCPLAVSYQIVREAEKFGIDCRRSIDGSVSSQVVVTNYERLSAFDHSKFSALVCDESSILKNFSGTTRSAITGFMRTIPHRLLCTATAAPNDYTELGTSSEALGEMGHMDMLARFFKNDQNTINPNRHWSGGKWRFRGHAELPFWRWVCSWATSIRRPSDLGYSDDRFVLPRLEEHKHIFQAETKRPGMLFNLPANGFREEREELRVTLAERCERAASLVDHNEQAIVWCHLNDEGDRLERDIKDAEQVKGSDSDNDKESRLLAFANGDIRVLVTKPKIGAWGLNLQRCAHVVYFPSHSYEQYYQAVRRCWRYGQTKDVRVDVVATEGQRAALDSLTRKAAQADVMFSNLVNEMKSATDVRPREAHAANVEVPQWMNGK